MHEAITNLLHEALLGVGTLLATALVGLVLSWMKKHGIEATAAQHDFLMKLALDGIAFAEEKAAHIGEDRSKSELAVQFVVDRSSLAPGEAHDLIHAALPGSGFGATAPEVAAPAPFDPTKSVPK